MSIFNRRSPLVRRAAAHALADSCGTSVGRWRQWLVPGAVLVSLVAAAIAGMNWLVQASRPGRLALESRQPLAELQALLAGQDLHVPAGAGIRAWRQSGVDLVLLRARADGEPQRISLCDQRTGAKDDPARIYPLALLGALPESPAPLLARRNPVVLSPLAASGLPTVWLEGSAPDEPSAQRLRLRVQAPAVQQSAGAWQVAMAEQQGVAKSGGALAFGYSGQAWVLWSPPESGGAGKPAAAEAGAPIAHTRAVRLRTVPLAGCGAGAVEWTLFAAQGLDEIALAGPSTLWARRAHARGPDTMHLRVSTGEHRVPDFPPAQLEDRELFELAVQRGLIRLLPDGRVAMVAADALRMAGPAAQASGAGGPTAPLRSLIKALHHSANGDFVRAQVAQANRARHWVAVRVRQTEGPAAIESDTTLWRAQSGGELLHLEAGMPPVSARLFAAPPVDWGDWVRIRAPQAWVAPALSEHTSSSPLAGVDLTLPLRAVPAGQAAPGLELLVLGRLASVTGAALMADSPLCNGPGCAAPTVLRRVVLQPVPGAASLTLHLLPEPGFNRLQPAATEQLRVQVRHGALTWVEAPAGSGPRPAPAEVRILARDGTPLHAGGQPTALARELGLAPLLGVGPTHDRSVAGALARLGSHGQAQARAVITLEPHLQAALHQVLRCVGAQDGRWLAAEGRCDTSARAVHADPRRITSAVVMDAHSGDIVATVPGSDPPPGMLASDLLAFDAFNPATSPLRVGGWHHTGGTAHSPGSGFKVVDALALELAAQRQPSLLPLLDGVPAARLDTLALEAGKRFETGSACYPAPCADKRAHVQNFDAAPASRYLRNGRMGLVDAMRNSVNTWFAFTVEYTDRTVPGGHADARPLGAGALQAERPMQTMLERLGFGQAQPLDGGLFPRGFVWQPGDALKTTPSHLDPIHDEHGVRQQALGLRLQTTPLQMARTAAAVATGHVPDPHLLVSLNEQRAVRQPMGLALNLPLHRVRSAMGEVVRTGTAAGAFSSPTLGQIRQLVHGKTGSAPLAGRDVKTDCKKLPMAAPAPLACQNNAWFVGYLAPGALPGERRTLAFAVEVSHTRFTGGAQAAPVVAGWIETLWAQQAAAAQAVAPAKP